MVKITNEWDEILKEEFASLEYQKLRQFLKEEYSNYKVFPSMYDIFNSMKYTAFEDVKVVLLGQDPYHNDGQAMGLSFSVPDGVQVPPSLVNMYKELKAELDIPIKNSGNLIGWAKQGVLLLNTTLTVREGAPQSHKGRGWETFTDRVISELNKKQAPIVFLLWGTPAKNKGKLITNPIHKKLETVHPSPLSAYGGFFGCKHFSRCNEILISSGQKPIDWQI